MPLPSNSQTPNEWLNEKLLTIIAIVGPVYTFLFGLIRGIETGSGVTMDLIAAFTSPWGKLAYIFTVISVTAMIHLLMESKAKALITVVFGGFLGLIFAFPLNALFLMIAGLVRIFFTA